MDDATSDAGSTAPHCPWCSAELSSTDQTTCLSCGATLASESEPQIPGVTTVAAGTSSVLSKPQKRSRLLQWISGDAEDEGSAPVAAPGSLAPPPEPVRREIRRLELEAELTNLSAEASAIAAEDALEARAANDLAAADAALQVVHDARSVSEAIESGTLQATGATVDTPLADSVEEPFAEAQPPTTDEASTTA